MKHNKFKISKTSAKIFKKEHGYKVGNHKIKSQSSSTANIPMVVEELGNYYKDITSEDRILAIGNKEIISKQAKLGNSMEINNINTDITTTASSYTKFIMEELNNKKDITGKINNAILTCDNENTDMKDVEVFPINILVGNDVGTTLGTTSVGDGESTMLGQHNNNNSVGDGEGTTLGTTLVGAGKSTTLGANITVNPVGVVVGTTLGTTLVGASENITLGENFNNTVGLDVGTTLGTISVGASEGTTLGENYNSNSVGAQVGSTLGTISVNNREIPSRHEIIETSTFGKTSKDHSFTSEACFKHTLIFILKSGFLADTEQKTY